MSGEFHRFRKYFSILRINKHNFSNDFEQTCQCKNTCSRKSGKFRGCVSLRRGRPLFESFMLVNSEGKQPNIYTQSTNYKFSNNIKDASAAAYVCGLKWYSPMIENNRQKRLTCITENGAGTVLARNAFWLSVVL